MSRIQTNRRYPVDEKYFSAIDTPGKAYWLGFIAADGNIYYDKAGNGKLSVSLASVDYHHLEQLRVALGYAGAPRMYGDYSTLRIGSTNIANDLVSHGVVPAKCHILTPWSGDDTLLPHYWRGVFDGDGCISKYQGARDRACGYTSWYVSLTGNEAMVSAFQEWARSRTEYTGCVQRRFRSFQVKFEGVNAAREITKLMYLPGHTSLPRKLKLAQELIDAPVRKSRLDEYGMSGLEDLYDHIGSWRGVARHINTTHSNIRKYMNKRKAAA